MKKIILLLSILVNVLFSNNCIGYTYESKIVQTAKVPTVKIISPKSLPNSGIVNLSADSSMDSRATPYYRWCTNIGTLHSNDNNFENIQWILPSNWEEKKYRVRIYLTAGDSLGAEVSVKKEFKGTIDLDPNKPLTKLAVQYIPSEDKFKVSWQSKNTKNLEILYSYDQNSWSRFAFLNLNNYNGSSDTERVNNSKQHETIYFKAVSSKNGKSSTSTITLNYKKETPNTGNKDVETPVRVEMKSLDNHTRSTSVRVSWQMVKDSHGNDNAVKYEIQYADNRNFDNAQTLNAGHVLSYTISNLIDDEQYYFRVRAINNVEPGRWSVYESTRIDVENRPDFDTSYQVPANGTIGVTKTPIFRWRASDKDGDDLWFYVRIGTDRNNLNYKSGWLDGKKYFDFMDKYTRALKPNTKYYWQVTYREKHRMSDYYEGGVYPTSDIWSFTTEGTGPDLAVTNVRMLGDVKIDEWVSFEVTIKNNGSEVADDQDIIPYFVNASTTNKGFAAYKRGVMHNQLSPGEEEKVIVKVQFSNKIEERTFTHFKLDGSEEEETVQYDNILMDGNNPVRFALDYNQYDVDTNSVNDSKVYAVNYSLADNLPVIEYTDLVRNFLSQRKGDARYMLDWNVTYRIDAEDQLKIDKYEMEYRVSENDTWHLIKSYTNNDADISTEIVWQIPNREELITQTMQLRVKVYNPSGKYTSIVSKQFKVFENDINVDELYVDKSSYKTNEKITVTYATSHKTEIEYFRIYIKQGSTSETLFEYKEDDIFDDANSIQFTIPNESSLLGDDAYIEILIKDINGAYQRMPSSHFSIVQNTDVPKVFSPYEDIFTQEYTNFPSLNTTDRYGNTVSPPSYGIHQDTKNHIVKLSVKNDIAHILFSQKGEWRYNYYRGGVQDKIGYEIKYFYMTYNLVTKYISSAKLLFSSTSENNIIPDEGYRDFIMNGNIAIMITKNSNTKKVKMYKLVNNNLQVSPEFTTDNYGYGELANYNGKTYIAYTTDNSVQANRRFKRKELYPNFGASNKNVLDEYLGRYHRIHGNEIYFYEKGIFYQLNSDMTVNSSTKQEIGVQVAYVRGKVDIYDTTTREALLDENQTLILYKKNGIKEKLSDIHMTAYEAGKGLIVSIYTDKVIVCHYSRESKKFKVIVYNRQTQQTESIYVGNIANQSGRVYNIAYIENQKLVIGNPDGDYDDAAQLITADLTNGLSSVPSISVEADKIANIGDDTTISWSLSKESDKLSNFKIYKVTKNSVTLLDTEYDTSIRTYAYTPVDINDRFVTIKVVANYNDGESSSDQVSLQVLGNVSFNTFNVDKTDININERLIFNWDTSGANSNNEYRVLKQCDGEIKWTELFKTKETQYTYKVQNFSGVCQFKIASEDAEKILDVPVTINGDIFRFKENGFSPMGNYESSEGIVKFEWEVYFEGTPSFNLLIKKSGENSFTQVTTTANTYVDYAGDVGSEFDWKVSFEYAGQMIESDEMHVSLNALDSPVIISNDFTVNQNINKVTLSYVPVADATSYEIYRSQYGNHFEKIAAVNNFIYEDTTVNYGETYSYFVVATKGTKKSLASEKVSVSAKIDETYEVVMDTANYQQLVDNALTLEYRPNKTTSFESYEILVGTDVDNLYTYDLTNSRSYALTGLEYGTTYYVEVYPLDKSGKRVSTLPAKLIFTTGFDTREVTSKASISIDEVSPDHVSISWDEVPNAESYTVCRKEDAGVVECLETVSATSYVDSINLVQGSSYQYIVKATNSGTSFSVSNASIEVVPDPVEDDLDGDGISDNLDPDIDGDGIMNDKDAFPRDKGEWLDTDGDGIGNNEDDDDDNDGVLDYNDDLPLNSHESVDTDHDGTGNNADKDDDNDGISDTDEIANGLDPLDPSDGGDDDIDGDGVSNKDEIEAGSDPLDPDDTKKPTRFVPIMMDDLMVMVPYKQ